MKLSSPLALTALFCIVFIVSFSVTFGLLYYHDTTLSAHEQPSNIPEGGGKVMLVIDNPFYNQTAGQEQPDGDT